MKKLRVLALGLCLSIALLGTAAAQGAKESAAPISCFDSYFVIDAAGDLYGWGNNLWGTNFSADKYGKQALILKDAVSVASGQWSAFAINSKGELWGWGSTQFGLLPDTYTGKPVHVLDGVKAVTIGSRHVAALKTDGSLWSWGHNDNAQMAGKTTADRVPAGSPIQIMSNIAAVAAVGDTTYALNTDGKVYGWGDAVVTASGCGPAPAPVSIMKDVKSLAALHQGLLVIKSDDSLWGKGATALLADEGCTYAKFTKLLDNVAFCNPGIAIQKDGSLLTWGNNHSGQLADGTPEHRCAPTKVADGILYAETGLNGTMAIRNTGELVVAGEGATTAGFHVVLQNAMLPSTASRIDRGNTYVPYVDITEKDWFYPYAKQCQEHGLVNGIMAYNGLSFSPQGVFNDWQIVTVAVRLYCSYNQVALPDTNGALTWWRPYMDAAAKYGLISQEENAQGDCDQEGMELFARLLTDIFPASYFPAINSIEKLPDVDVSTDLGKRILLLYNAGVLTGSDEYGRFSRRGNPTYRSEAAAVISRVIQPQLRVKFTPKALTPPVLKELPLDKADAYITGFDGRYLYATKGATGKKFIADLNGKILLEADGWIYPVQGDVVRVGLQAEDETYSTVYYSLTGKRLTEKTYASGTDFNDGLAAVQERQGGEISLMNTAGEVVRRFENKMNGRVSSPPSEGYFLVRSESANYMVKMETGETTKLGGLNVAEFSEGRLQVVSEDYKVGFRNPALEFAIPYSLSASTEDFHSGLAVTMGEGGLFGAIGPDGKVVLPYQYRHLSSFNADGHAMATVELDGLWTDCVIDKTGKVIQRFQKKDHSTFTLHGGIVVRGTIFEYHFYRLDGTEVVPGLVAQNFTASSTGRLIVEVDGKYYLIDAIAPE